MSEELTGEEIATLRQKLLTLEGELEVLLEATVEGRGRSTSASR